jgi:hypothetical protein
VTASGSLTSDAWGARAADDSGAGVTPLGGPRLYQTQMAIGYLSMECVQPLDDLTNGDVEL